MKNEPVLLRRRSSEERAEAAARVAAQKARASAVKLNKVQDSNGAAQSVNPYGVKASTNANVVQTLLAAGISVAMFTTAGGLIVAIPTLILHSVITTRTNKIMDDVDQYGLKTLNLLTARRRGTLKEDAAAS